MLIISFKGALIQLPTPAQILCLSGLKHPNSIWLHLFGIQIVLYHQAHKLISCTLMLLSLKRLCIHMKLASIDIHVSTRYFFLDELNPTLCQFPFNAYNPPEIIHFEDNITCITSQSIFNASGEWMTSFSSPDQQKIYWGVTNGLVVFSIHK